MKAILSLFVLVCLSAGLVPGPAGPVSAAGLPGGNHFPLQAATITRYKTLSGLDFHPFDPAVQYTLPVDGRIYPDSAAAQFYAGVDLPGDASVTDVTFFFIDSNASVDMTFMFKKDSPNGTSLDVWPPVTNTINSYQLQSISFCPPSCSPSPVGGGAYSYHLLVNFGTYGPYQELFGARITYTEPDVPVPDDNLTLVGTDFRPASSQVNFAATGTSIHCTGNLPDCSFMAPLFLPQGSQITQIVYYIVDNSSDKNLALHLVSFNPQSQSLELLNDSSTVGLPNLSYTQTLTVHLSPPVIIDNATRSYAISIQPEMASMEQQIVGVHIYYTPGPANNFQARTLAGYDFEPNFSKVDYGILGGAIFPQVSGSAGPFTTSLDPPAGNAGYIITFYYKKLAGASGNLTFEVKSYDPGEPKATVLQTYNTNAISGGDSLQHFSFIGTLAILGQVDAQHINLRLEVTPSAADNRLMLFGAQVKHFIPVNNYLPIIKR